MASPELDVATGLSMTLAGTSISSREIEDFTLPACEIDEVPSSHQGTTECLTFIPADLFDGGYFECSVHHMQGYDYFADVGISGACVVTCPSGATVSFTGFIKAYTPRSSTLNGPMLADVRIRVCSDPVIVDA